MNFFEVENLRAVTAGRWMRRPQHAAPLDGVGIDTRSDLQRRVFVAIRGERHDGHDFLADAVAGGAKLLVVRQDLHPAASFADLPPDVGVLGVADPRKALGQLAKAYRRSLAATKVIAVTGSTGKTTTKRLIHAVLATTLPGSEAPRSYNNDIGVPLSILAVRPTDRYVVLEVGTSAPGEIAALGEVIEPDIAVITSIGRAHVEHLGSLEQIAAEKASLLLHLRSGGAAIVCADAPHLEPHLRIDGTVIRYGEAEDADLRLTDRGSSAGGGGGWLEINGRVRCELPLPGRHNALNAIAAVAVARRLGVTDERIRKGLAAAVPVPMRMTMHAIGTWTVYNDAYNANPEAMAASLEAFAEVAADASHRVVVLGDMFELGEHASAAHDELGRHLIDLDTRTRLDHVALVGEHMAHAAAVLGRVWPAARFTHHATLDAAAKGAIANALAPGAAVLVKGSRSMALEQFIEWLDTSRGDDAPQPVVNRKEPPRRGERGEEGNGVETPLAASRGRNP